MTEELQLLGVIPFAQDEAVDRKIESVVRTLQQKNIRVAGFVQHAETVEGQCCGAVDVEDIETGDRFQIMQALGTHAKGCRLDPGAMADVAVRALASFERRPDILILNRFGKGEAEGGGLRSVFEAASLAGIPVLTSVKETFLPAWSDFAGDLTVSLSQDEDRILAWCADVIESSQGVTHAA